MRARIHLVCKDESGQDMVEYALLAGFVAVGSGILLPVGVVGSIGQIWTKVRDLLERYASQPG